MYQLNNIIEEFKKDIKSIEYLQTVSDKKIFTKNELEELYETIDELQEVENTKDILTKKISNNKEEIIEFCATLQSKAAMISYTFKLVKSLTDKFLDNFLNPLEISTNQNFKVKEINIRKFYDQQIALHAAANNNIIIQEVFASQYCFGFTIFDRNLEKIKNVLVKEDFWVHELYKQFSHENELLIFNNEEQILIYVNIINNTYFIIPLSTISDDIYFSRYYHWVGDIFTVLSTDGEGYQLNLQTKKITNIPINSVKDYFPFLKELNYMPSDIRFYPINMEKSQYIFKDCDNGRYEFIDYKKNERFIIDFFDDESYKYLYKDDLLVIICERQIVIFKDQKQVAMLKTNIPHAILGAEFLNNGSKLVVLVDNQNSHVQRMYIYEITSK